MRGLRDGAVTFVHGDTVHPAWICVSVWFRAPLSTNIATCACDGVVGLGKMLGRGFQLVDAWCTHNFWSLLLSVTGPDRDV